MPRMTAHEKYQLVLQIQKEREQETPWREISIKMGQKESWASVFFKRNEQLLKDPPKAEPSLSTKLPEIVDTPQVEKVPSPPRQAPPRRPSKEVEALKSQMDMLMGALMIPPEQREFLDLTQRMTPQARQWALAIGILLDALEKNKEQGTIKFKPRDLKDTQEQLGEDAFQWAWRFLMATGIIIQEKHLTDELIEALQVTKTTGGRYVYNFLLLEGE